jgi:uncharacterized protein Usg
MRAGHQKDHHLGSTMINILPLLFCSVLLSSFLYRNALKQILEIKSVNLIRYETYINKSSIKAINIIWKNRGISCSLKTKYNNMLIISKLVYKFSVVSIIILRGYVLELHNIVLNFLLKNKYLQKVWKDNGEGIIHSCLYVDHSVILL